MTDDIGAVLSGQPKDEYGDEMSGEEKMKWNANRPDLVSIPSKMEWILGAKYAEVPQNILPEFDPGEIFDRFHMAIQNDTSEGASLKKIATERAWKQLEEEFVVNYYSAAKKTLNGEKHEKVATALPFVFQK